MKRNKLAAWRRVFGLIFFGLLLLSFADFTGFLPTWFIRWAGYFQFVPSLLKFLHAPSLLAIGFLLILFITWIWGRVYCSWICPLGVLQDIVARLKILKKKRSRAYGLLPSFKILRYSVLILVVAGLLSGLMQPLMYTDPYSLFGRMIHQLVFPLFLFLNNYLSGYLSGLEIYFLKPFPVTGFQPASLAFSVTLLALLIFLSVRYGRIYCTAWCPVGSFLGFVSKFSIYKIRISKESCTSCGRCAKSCKAGCIDYHNKEVDFERCVGCFNCLNSCPTGGIHFQKTFRTHSLNFSPERRHHLWLLTAAGTGLLLKPKVIWAEELQKALVPAPRLNPVTPPGSISTERFNDICTACHLCISACPTRVLSPSLTEYGWRGLFQPMMDYHTSFCNYECTRCGEVCPTGAILPLLPEEKKLTQLGVAAFQKLNCVVYTEETACGACSEHCPTKAVHMVPYKEGLLIPKVNEAICIGCGACEYACPTLPHKAIYVKAHTIHQKAQKPEESDTSKEEVPEEFPF
ncbi:MAG: 4Fe-4S dicluster domain-containing protein [Bacteroidota bacterium]|jgi:ferredoxin